MENAPVLSFVLAASVSVCGRLPVSDSADVSATNFGLFTFLGLSPLICIFVLHIRKTHHYLNQFKTYLTTYFSRFK